jgi:hypothetical protein
VFYRRIIVFVFILLAQLVWPSPSIAEQQVPSGFRLDSHEQLADGLEHLVLKRSDPPLVVHIARISPQAQVALRVVLSNEAVAGPEPRKELTSSMCIRVQCLAAVNGDFSIVETGEPLGGVVAAGEPIRSPNRSHHQLTVSSDSTLHAGTLDWSATLMPSDLRPVTIAGMNVPRSENQVVVYTSDYGPSTDTNEYGAELVAEIVDPPPPLHVGQTAQVRLTDFRDGQGNSSIPTGGIVLSGHGSGERLLRELWAKSEQGTVSKQALLRFDTSPDAVESVGGTPILLRDGKVWVSDEPEGLVGSHHPRTLAAWNAEGFIWLVTVDGRQPGYSVGMKLVEAAEFLLGLGATEAINLDGGGSTTFVVRGAVRNRPSDRAIRRGGDEFIVPIPSQGERVIGNVERPRPIAIAIVAKNASLAGSRPTLEIALPRRTIDAPTPEDTDAGSSLFQALPALVNARSNDPNQSLALIAAIANSLVMALLLLRVTRLKKEYEPQKARRRKSSFRSGYRGQLPPNPLPSSCPS